MSDVLTEELPPIPDPGLFEQRIGELEQAREQMLEAATHYVHRPFSYRRQQFVRRSNDVAETFRSVVEVVFEDDKWTLEEKAKTAGILLHEDNKKRVAHLESIAPGARLLPGDNDPAEITKELLLTFKEFSDMYEDEADETEHFISVVCDVQEHAGMSDYDALTEYCEGKWKGRAINLGHSAIEHSGDAVKWWVRIGGALVVAKAFEHFVH